MRPCFPLVQLPRRVIYVDDQGSFLDILRKTMPRGMSRQFMTSPQAALAALQQEMAYWQSIESALASVNHERPHGEAAHYVNRYFRDWRRFHLTTVLIADYAMPGMNGIELIERLGAMPARRILLTGAANAEVAIRAFNAGLIQRFIPKATPGLYRELKACCEDVHVTVCEHMGHLTLGQFTPAQIELLHDPEVIRALRSKVDEMGWIEYVAVSQPFGLLGMPHAGPLQWLQLQSAPDAARQANELGALGFPAAAAKEVRLGTALSTHDIDRELGLPEKPQLVDAFPLTMDGDLLGGITDLPLKALSASDYGVDDTFSTDEVMRSLLRDVTMAMREPFEAGDGDSPFSEAVNCLVATASLSRLHADALHAALRESRLPPLVLSLIQVKLARVQIQSARRA